MGSSIFVSWFSRLTSLWPVATRHRHHSLPMTVARFRLQIRLVAVVLRRSQAEIPVFHFHLQALGGKAVGCTCLTLHSDLRMKTQNSRSFMASLINAVRYVAIHFAYGCKHCVGCKLNCIGFNLAFWQIFPADGAAFCLRIGFVTTFSI